MGTKKSGFVRAIEGFAGESIDSLREMSLDDRRCMLEKKHGHPMEFISKRPFVGRGHVGGKPQSHAKVDERLRKALR
jgi:hypothetical protein